MRQLLTEQRHGARHEFAVGREQDQHRKRGVAELPGDPINPLLDLAHGGLDIGLERHALWRQHRGSTASVEQPGPDLLLQLADRA